MTNIGLIKIQVDFLGTWNKGHAASLHLREPMERRLAIDGRAPAYVARFRAKTIQSIPDWSQRIEFSFPMEYTWEELEDRSLMSIIKDWPCKIMFFNAKGKEERIEALVDLQFGGYYKR